LGSGAAFAAVVVEQDGFADVFEVLEQFPDGQVQSDVPRAFRTARFVANSCGELPIHELVADLSWCPVLES
jgi:hypothetical protein